MYAEGHPAGKQLWKVLSSECDQALAKAVQEVESPSLEVLKNPLDMVLGIWLLVALCEQGLDRVCRGSPATSPWL